VFPWGVLKILGNRHMGEQVYADLIKLILKGIERDMVRNWRPIILLNVSYNVKVDLSSCSRFVLNVYSTLMCYNVGHFTNTVI